MTGQAVRMDLFAQDVPALARLGALLIGGPYLVFAGSGPFADPRHRTVADAIERCRRISPDAGLPEVTDDLRERGLLAAIGGASYLAEVCECAPPYGSTVRDDTLGAVALLRAILDELCSVQCRLNSVTEATMQAIADATAAREAWTAQIGRSGGE